MLGLFRHFTQSHIRASELELSRFHLQGTMNDHLMQGFQRSSCLYFTLSNVKGEGTKTDINLVILCPCQRYCCLSKLSLH